MPKIKVLPHEELCPEGIEFEAEEGKSVCENLLNHSVDIEHACELSCACTTCHVIFVEGFNSLNESSDDEEDLEFPVDDTVPPLPMFDVQQTVELHCCVKDTADAT